MSLLYCKDISIYYENDLIFKIESISAYQIKNKDCKKIPYKKYKIEYNYTSKETDLFIDFNSNDCPIKLFQNTNYWIKIAENKLEKELTNFFWKNHFQIKEIGEDNFFRGEFNTGNYVGILNMDSIGIIENLIEVESKKINYKEDFYYLLEEIADFSIDLISQSSSYLENRLKKGNVIDISEKNSYSKFAFVKNLLREENIPCWIDYIEKNNHSKLESFKEKEYIWNIDDLDIDDYIDATSNKSNIFKYTTSNGSIRQIPLEVYITKYTDSIDTKENQFIKFFLEYIMDFLVNLKNKINKDNKKILNELENSINIVEDKLEKPFFRKISKMNSIPFNSQVLQKKYPYNKIFKAYNDILLVSKISLDILDEQFCIGQKDVAKLYEYWVFIKIFNMLNKKYKSNFDKCNWITYDEGNLSINLNTKENNYVYYYIESNLVLRLYYNKTYISNYEVYDDKSYAHEIGTSYSHELNPDISLELYKDKKLLGIIHFDAKYKIPNNKEYNPDDINKMHTYKDAIIGTIGSYALCLSEKTKIFIQGESSKDKIFPSVGALPMNINSKTENNDLKKIFMIINEFIELSKEK